MGGPIGNRFRVEDEKLLEQFIVVKYQLIDDVDVTQVGSAIEAWEKLSCQQGDHAADGNNGENYLFGRLPFFGFEHG